MFDISTWNAFCKFQNIGKKIKITLLFIFWLSKKSSPKSHLIIVFSGKHNEEDFMFTMMNTVS